MSGSLSLTHLSFDAVKLPGEFSKWLRHFPCPISSKAFSPISTALLSHQIIADRKTFLFSSLSMGNPHCVIFVDDVNNFPIHEYGPLIENNPIFPERVNVEFIQVVSESELIQRTWERGAEETWACGTGATAVSVISHLLGHTKNKVTIHLLGGDLDLHYHKISVVR